MNKLCCILLGVLSIGLAFFSCNSDECETSLDCGPGQACTNGTCTNMESDIDVDGDIDGDADMDSDSDTDSGTGFDPEFITVWKTDNKGESNSNQVLLPLVENGEYDFTVYWGDKTEDTITSWDDSSKLHTYKEPGEYTVTIDGQITGWSFGETSEGRKLVMILNWGSLSFGDTTAQFRGCLDLVIFAQDTPDISQTTSLFEAFANCSIINGISAANWDTSNVTDMGGMFKWANNFNDDLSGWDTSNVTNMEDMFFSADVFNGDVTTWDTSSVTTMKTMFGEAKAFDKDLNGWDTSNVTDMSYMFEGAQAFNSQLSEWDVSNVTLMRAMFNNANSFDQDLSNWDVTSVTGMYEMFENTELSTENYDALLISWADQDVQTGVSFTAGGSQYSAAAIAARAVLTDTYLWTITDGGQN